MHRRRSRDRRDRKPRDNAPAPAVSKRRPREGTDVPSSLRLSSAKRQPSTVHPRPSTDVVLVTGFECFGGETVNPSWEICVRLPREIAGMRVETCRVPCEFRRAIEVVAEAIERHRPAIVISLGLAGSRDRIGVERVAINVDDARIPDNAGAQPVDQPIAANGPPAYFATVPVKAMAHAIRAAGIPAEVSNTAGTYVCNHLMYGVLHFLAASGKKARAGFIHVPYLEAKRAMPSMALDSMVKGIGAAIDAAARTTVDIAAAEGALD